MSKTFPAPWRIEREDEDSGEIAYHIWSVVPVEWLFTIRTRDHANAQGLAKKIVRTINEAAILDNYAHDMNVSAEGLGLRVRQNCLSPSNR
jgi:hypothetical protein